MRILDATAGLRPDSASGEVGGSQIPIQNTFGNQNSNILLDAMLCLHWISNFSIWIGGIGEALSGSRTVPTVPCTSASSPAARTCAIAVIRLWSIAAGSGAP